MPASRTQNQQPQQQQHSIQHQYPQQQQHPQQKQHPQQQQVELTMSTKTTIATPPPNVPITNEAAVAAPPCSDTGRVNTSEALSALREAMRQPISVHDSPVDAFIVISTDEHMSQEPAEQDKRLQFVSGWSGEGYAVIVAGHVGGSMSRFPSGAALWTPAYSTGLARKTVSCGWLVYDGDDVNSPTLGDWLTRYQVKRVGADSRLVEYAVWQLWEEDLRQHEMELINIVSLLDNVWNKYGRPQPNKVIAFVQEMEQSGRDWREKVAELRTRMKDVRADAMAVTALDEIGWLLNMRGKDLPYSPLVKTFLVVTHLEIYLFIKTGKLGTQVRNHLDATMSCYTANCTRIMEYETIYLQLRTLSQMWQRVLLPKATSFHRGASEAIVQTIPYGKRLLEVSPIIYMKAKKNENEIKSIIRAHVADGTGMCELFEYIEKAIKTQAPRKNDWTEFRVKKQIDEQRNGLGGNRGLSLPTVVAFGPNGGIPNYKASETVDSPIFKNSTLIIRSGGQYTDGTTVLTRTMHYGLPSSEQRTAYTQVLRSLIALSSLVWPAHVPAARLDHVAQGPLWSSRRKQPHATGHGIGAFLNYREDPINIDFNSELDTPLESGYFVTNEPGWYEPFRFGVRLGNVLRVVPAKKSITDQGGPYLAFEDITLVPFEPRLIDKSLLTKYEKQWLNDYNKKIRRIIGPELKAQQAMNAFYWMMNKTILIDEDQPRPILNDAGAIQPRFIKLCVVVVIAMCQLVD